MIPVNRRLHKQLWNCHDHGPDIHLACVEDAAYRRPERDDVSRAAVWSFFSQVWTWVLASPRLLLGLGIFSALAFFGTIVAIPLLAVRIPTDYFVKRQGFLRAGSTRPVLRILGGVARNLIGTACVVAGIAMLVLPGQGVLTILIGIMLLDFPGKHALECAIVRQRQVFRAINWMRTKAGKPALEYPRKPTDT